MLGKFLKIYWNQPPKVIKAKRLKKLATPELNKEFIKGTYGQKQSPGQQQDGESLCPNGVGA